MSAVRSVAKDGSNVFKFSSTANSTVSLRSVCGKFMCLGADCLLHMAVKNLSVSDNKNRIERLVANVVMGKAS